LACCAGENVLVINTCTSAVNQSIHPLISRLKTDVTQKEGGDRHTEAKTRECTNSYVIKIRNIHKTTHMEHKKVKYVS